MENCNLFKHKHNFVHESTWQEMFVSLTLILTFLTLFLVEFISEWANPNLTVTQHREHSILKNLNVSKHLSIYEYSPEKGISQVNPVFSVTKWSLALNEMEVDSEISGVLSNSASTRSFVSVSYETENRLIFKFVFDSEFTFLVNKGEFGCFTLEQVEECTDNSIFADSKECKAYFNVLDRSCTGTSRIALTDYKLRIYQKRTKIVNLLVKYSSLSFLCWSVAKLSLSGMFSHSSDLKLIRLLYGSNSLKPCYFLNQDNSDAKIASKTDITDPTSQFTFWNTYRLFCFNAKSKQRSQFISFKRQIANKLNISSYFQNELTVQDVNSAFRPKPKPNRIFMKCPLNTNFFKAANPSLSS